MALVSMKFNNGYSGIMERSHLGCPLGTFDLRTQHIEEFRNLEKRGEKRTKYCTAQTSARCGTVKYRSPKLSCPANCKEREN